MARKTVHDMNRPWIADKKIGDKLKIEILYTTYTGDGLSGFKS